MKATWFFKNQEKETQWSHADGSLFDFTFASNGHKATFSLSMTLRVTQYDEAILRRSGLTVESFDEDLRLLAENMLDTM